MLRSGVRAVFVGGVIAMLSTASLTHAAVTVGSTIEVREGDTWTKVKVIGTEGRRVHVEYDDGTQEWVGSDRTQADGAATPQTNPPATPPVMPTTPGSDNPGATTPAASHAERFSNDDAVEFKHDGRWIAAHVRQVTPTWIFVASDDKRGEKYWVEPWAVRLVGSGYDVNSGGTHQRATEAGQLPPKERPLSQPAFVGNRFVAVSADQVPPTKDDLEKTFDTVSFDNTHEPAKAEAPLNLPTTRPIIGGGDFAAWGIHNTQNRLSSLLTCANSVKTAVTAYSGSFGTWTVIIRANLRGHGQFDTRYLTIPDLKVMAAGDDGDALLSICDWDRKLQYWKWDKTGYKLAANLLVEENQKNRIENALFVGQDRAVVRESDGQVVLIDLEKKQVISTIGTVPTSQLFMHPSGQLIGVITGRGTAMLLRTSDFAILGEYDDAGTASNVCVDPSGQFAAYPTSAGSVRVVRISDNADLGMISVGASFVGRLDLADDKFLIVNGATVYDVKSGIPVWLYKLPQNAMFTALISGQFLIAAPGDNMASIAIATIPDQTGRAALKSATPDRFMLKPGTSIKIDGDFGAFGADSSKASDTVTAAVQSAGMTVSTQDEAFHLAIAVAAGPTIKRDYAPDIFAGPFRKVETLDVPSSILTATLNYKGEPVWKQEIQFAAGDWIHRDVAKQSFQDVTTAAAKPNITALKTLNIPSYLPTGAKPGTPAALGESVLRGPRFVPDHPANDKHTQQH